MEPVQETPQLSAGEVSDEIIDDERPSCKQGAGPPTKKLVASRRWTPGVKVNLPWKFILALIGTVAWFGGCIGVIFAADRTKIDSWAISPTVIMAILGPLGSIMLQYALSDGLVITWWNSALSGTTLGTLHRQWDHGTSVWAAGTAGRHTDKIALAKLMVLFVFAVNPLLQRALITSLATEQTDVKLSTAAATDVKSLQNMNFTDVYMDGFWDPVQLTPRMSRIIQQFAEREPITGAIPGCTGNCSGTLIAAGIDAQCTTVRNTSYIADFGKGSGGATQVFKTGTNIMRYQTFEQFNLTVFYAELSPDSKETALSDSLRSCRGVSTTVNCVLQHAVIAYPFSQKDGIITPETQRSHIRYLSTEPAISSGRTPPDREPIFGGLSIAADAIFNSSGSVQTMGKYGWSFRTSGPLTATYLTRGSSNRTCAVAFDDPTENIITKLNEIMFRVALAVPDASSPRAEFTAQSSTVAIIYESRFAYLWAAMAVTVLAMVAVGRTASEFHVLGRSFSLSPLEIATAFDSQLLVEPETSNMAIEELMDVYRDVKIQYVSNEGCDPEDTVSEPRKRLRFAHPGHGRTPHAQELFDA
jgi:hypothetical protein